MLITKSVKVKWTSRNRKWYESKGYLFTQFGDEIEVETRDLQISFTGSKITMECINPECTNTKSISYACFIDRLRGNKPFLCTNCFQDGLRIEDFSKEDLDKSCTVNNCDGNVYKDDMCFKHYNQYSSLGKILKPLKHNCEVCGSEINIQLHTELNMYLCRKHRLQYDRNGYFQTRTIYDKNNIICHDNYAEVELYDDVGNVIEKTFIDIEDVEKVKKYKWHLGDTGYVITCIDGINLRLHKYILNQYGEEYKGHDYDKMVDHIDRDKLNNRKNNLRIVTDSENKQNIVRDKNRNGRTYLVFDKTNKTNPWKVQMNLNNNKVIDKGFKTKEYAEYVADIYELYYKPLSPNHENLKNKYLHIYNELIEKGTDYILNEYN